MLRKLQLVSDTDYFLLIIETNSSILTQHVNNRSQILNELELLMNNGHVLDPIQKKSYHILFFKIL